MLAQIKENIQNLNILQRIGAVSEVTGLMVESIGPDAFLGEECEIYNASSGIKVKAEVIALKNNKVMLMPYGDMRGVHLGSEVIATGKSVSVPVGDSLLGRVVDAFCNPLDGMEKPDCATNYPLYGERLNPLTRKNIDSILQTGVRVIDSMLTIGKGQRIGIFSGSGVGKSSLIGMISRHMNADVNVIALVGERGREVLDFIEKNLGENGLKKSVLVVATSDQPALHRTHAALTATSIAEYFRDQGLHVVLTMDSLTRYAMALREIGLAVGEPPTSRGYTPSVFANLPRLLERCGTSSSGGSITAFYSVLVEGDDLNDPIADAVRAILDGHIVLDRKIANRNIYPSIDILSSVSRLMNDLISADEKTLTNKIRTTYSTYTESKDMIELGVYKQGSNATLDYAVNTLPKIQEYFIQSVDDTTDRQEAMNHLNDILS